MKFGRAGLIAVANKKRRQHAYDDAEGAQNTQNIFLCNFH